MAVHGQLSEFESNEEDWQSYTERIKQYFAANEITAPAKQRAVLLTVCGRSTYRMIKNITAPSQPSEKTFDEIATLMSEHYNPKPTVTVQRCIFNGRTRKQGETVAEFVAELKKISEFCDFGDRLDEMLRDCVVCGINQERWQKRLLSEPGLTFKKAYEIAVGAESADQNMKKLRMDKADGSARAGAYYIQRVQKQLPVVDSDATGHAAGKPNGQPRSYSRFHSKGKYRSLDSRSDTNNPACFSCYHCNKNHKATACRFIKTICHHCGKQGHIQSACRSKQFELASSSRKNSQFPFVEISKADLTRS